MPLDVYAVCAPWQYLSLSLPLSVFPSLIRSFARSFALPALILFFLLSSSHAPRERRSASLHRERDAPSSFGSRRSSSSRFVVGSSSLPRPTRVARRARLFSVLVAPAPALIGRSSHSSPPASKLVARVSLTAVHGARTAARIDERIALSGASHISRYAAQAAPPYARLVGAGASRECFE